MNSNKSLWSALIGTWAVMLLASAARPTDGSFNSLSVKDEIIIGSDGPQIELSVRKDRASIRVTDRPPDENHRPGVFIGSYKGRLSVVNVTGSEGTDGISTVAYESGNRSIQLVDVQGKRRVVLGVIDGSLVKRFR